MRSKTTPSEMVTATSGPRPAAESVKRARNEERLFFASSECARPISVSVSLSLLPLICHMISTNGDGCFGGPSDFSVAGVSATISSLLRLLPATHYPMHDQPDSDSEREREWLFISLASLLNKLGSSLPPPPAARVHASAFSSSSGVGAKEEEEDLIEISEWPNVVARSPPPPKPPQPNRPTARLCRLYRAGKSLGS